MTDYNDDKWHGWNGGECPVHPKTSVEVVMHSVGVRTEPAEISASDDFSWWHDGGADIIAFRVIKPFIEPKVIWANDYGDNEWAVWPTKEDAVRAADASEAIRIAVRFVETPEEGEPK